MVRISIIALTVAVAGASLAVPTSAWATRGDTISSNTSAGSGLFSEVLSMSRHFRKADDSPNGLLAGHSSDPNDDDDEPATPPPTELSPVLWNFGYSYTSAVVSDTTTDQAHNFSTGLEWEMVPPAWESGIEFAYETIPVENYRQGAITMRFEYSFCLKKRSKPEPDTDEMDVSEYYKYKYPSTGARPNKVGTGGRKFKSLREYEAEQDEKRETVKLPTLTLDLDLGYFRHTREPSTDQAPTNTSAVLNQGMTELEAQLLLDQKWSFRAAASFYTYDASVNDFITALGVTKDTTLIIGGGITALNFPDMVFEQSVTDNLNPRWSLSLGLTETTFADPSQGLTFAVAPTVYRFLGRFWTLSASAELTVGSVTAITGSFGVSYGL